MLKFEQDLVSIPTKLFYSNSEEGSTLETLKLPDSIKHIGNSAFRDHFYLSELKLPNSLETIGNEAFQACGGIQSWYSLYIPNSVTSIGDYCFVICGINYLEFKGTLEQWSMVEKGEGWASDIETTVVHCTDGDAPIVQ